ncbi:AI-2E family transporter [Alkalilimnicola sp. S0819]|uniref:AI-2E family transporter n=1 Tax=Alkalilimnicola sp. S0819 TaxID=2613922 RepID=UPI0012624CE6|nr:AI-2E family transporter [Alkalilimnicola sp. S0819]KAB7623907.1 AI-2E family transporter [Alkalilimnicola sp. S0819]MPQ16502.1 AI-2E family transporter [Alkalilimnicola sp. S0819]
MDDLRPLKAPLWGLFALGVLYTLYLARELTLPITLAGLLSLLLAPVVTRLALYGVPRALSALALLALLLAAVGGIGVMVAGPVMDWAEEAPRGLSRLLVADGGLGEAWQRMTDSAREVEQQLSQESTAREPTTVVLQSESWRGQLLVRARDTTVAVALALALCYFLLVSGNALIGNIAAQIRSRPRRRTLLLVIRDAQREIARYLAVITLSNTTVGLLTGLMTMALGLPSPAVWGLLAGLLRFVPYLGVILATSLLAVVSATTQDGVWLMLAAPAGYLLLNTVVGFFLEPYIHGYRMAVNPIFVFLAIFVWGWFWGAVGVLLAVPLMTVIQVILRQIDALAPVYKVISRPAPRSRP